MPDIATICDRIGNPVFAILTNIVPLMRRLGKLDGGAGPREIVEEIRTAAQKVNDYIAELRTFESQWSPEWPTVPGKYWGYGFFSYMRLGHRLELADVRMTSKEGVYSYSWRGGFISEKDAVLLWLPAQIPELPNAEMVDQSLPPTVFL